MTLPALPEPDFIDRDPAAITAAMIAKYEAESGKTLQPAQVERLQINNFAYRETLVRIAVQEAAKQNLLYYARRPVLDHHAQLLGVAALPAAPAKTTLRFTFPAARPADLLIPLGTRVAATGALIFDTSAVAVLGAGATAIDVPAACETAGAVGNGWAAGALGTLLDDLGVSGVSVANLAASAGGAEAEADEPLRERVSQAPESFTTAGSHGAYQFWARSAHPSILDVATRAHYPEPGDLSIYVLVAGGAPSGDVLDAVLSACSDERVRPMNDHVLAVGPEQIDYAMDIRLTLYPWADADSALAAWQAAADDYRSRQAAALGKDVVRWQIESLLQFNGVYAVEVVSPAANIVLEPWQWPNCTALAVSVAGFAGG
jgi:phage-related baseplate assembly protein